MTSHSIRDLSVVLALLAALAPVKATSAAPRQDPPPSPPANAVGAGDDEPSPTEPDFTLINLPTALRLPRYRAAFRVTHRFTLPLSQGSFGDSASNLFGLDSGARIGLEFRFGLARGLQAGLYRTSDRTITFFTQYGVTRPMGGLPIAVAAVASVEGANNFKESRSPSLGAVIAATVGSLAAVYVEPTWVNNTNTLKPDLAAHTNTVYVGIGARIRLRKGTYFVAEASPRVAGFKGGGASPGSPAAYVEGRPLASFAIEKQVGGHVFQLNVSNAFATTPANIARGAPSGKTNWYLGFNITRKF